MLETELLLGEAARLLDAVGALAERITIVGGLVPALLVPEPPPHVGAHGGTRDIDLGLGIVLSGDEANDFRPLEPALLSLGYRPMGGEAEQYRWLGGPGDAVVVEFLCGRPRGFNDRDIVSIGDRLAACAFTAAGLAVVDRVRREISFGGKPVSVWVVGVGAFIALKLDALLDRAKSRDAFDIVWILRAWPGGPVGATATVGASQIADEPAWLGAHRDAACGLLDARVRRLSALRSLLRGQSSGSCSRGCHNRSGVPAAVAIGLTGEQVFV